MLSGPGNGGKSKVWTGTSAQCGPRAQSIYMSIQTVNSYWTNWVTRDFGGQGFTQTVINMNRVVALSNC